MKIFILLLLLVSNNLLIHAQSHKAALTKEAEQLLANKTEPSQILSNKKFDTLHSETSFRDLIKKYATAAPLKIINDQEPGKKIKVVGIVKDLNGKPVAGALIYLYQTDVRGWYAAHSPHVQANEGDFRHARIFGYLKTDANGRFELHTVKPSGYPRSDLPAHIHVHASANSYNDYETEFLFDDDERLIGTIRENSIRNRFLIAKPEKSPSPFDQQFSFNIILTGY